MKIDIKQVMLYALLCLYPAFALSCRTDSPPPLTNCLEDGSGGCEGTKAPSGERFYLKPSEMKNVACFPSADQLKAYVTWCYNP